MITLTEEQLRRLADWQPIEPGFDNPEERVAIFKALTKSLSASLGVGVMDVSDRGSFLPSYFSLFVFDKRRFPVIGERSSVSSDIVLEYDGIGINLSNLAPFAAIGRMSFSKWPDGRLGWDPIDLDTILDESIQPETIEDTVVAAVAQTPYRILTRAELSQPLPKGVVPYEYCVSEKPWDRYFHILFSDTD